MKLFLLLALTVTCNADFGPSGQSDIINVHNTLRSKIAKGIYVARGIQKPPGSNILKMKWDTSIAASAQNYANSCPTGHSGIDGLGENLYWYWTSGSLGDLNQYGAAASSSWEKEFQDYGWKSNLLTSDLFNTGIGHATQMAWANSNLIGCGVKDCGRDSNGMNKVTVVCHYKSQGNYLNEYIYHSGGTCSRCPSGTSCETRSGLCV